MEEYIVAANVVMGLEGNKGTKIWIIDLTMDKTVMFKQIQSDQGVESH